MYLWGIRAVVTKFYAQRAVAVIVTKNFTPQGGSYQFLRPGRRAVVTKFYASESSWYYKKKLTLLIAKRLPISEMFCQRVVDGSVQLIKLFWKVVIFNSLHLALATAHVAKMLDFGARWVVWIDALAPHLGPKPQSAAESAGHIH